LYQARKRQADQLEASAQTAEQKQAAAQARAEAKQAQKDGIDAMIDAVYKNIFRDKGPAPPAPAAPAGPPIISPSATSLPLPNVSLSSIGAIDAAMKGF
jgi:hypothetical protein